MMFFVIVVVMSLILGVVLGRAIGRGEAASKGINVIIDRAKFPVAIAEKIEGNYYLFEKDTNNFLCQAPSMEELPKTLFENKKISLALVMCPEETKNTFWFINGKLKNAVHTL